MTTTSLPQLSVALPPTQAELPCDDGIPMETQRHKLQISNKKEQKKPNYNCARPSKIY